MIGRTIALMLVVLVSAAGTAQADGVGWGPGSTDGILMVIGVVALLGVWGFYTFLKYLLAATPVEKPAPPAVVATARVHREMSPPT